MNKANLAWGAVVAVLTAIFGKYWFLFAGFLMLNVLDYASGTYRDWLKGMLSSATGAKGIVKKVWYWVVIGIAFYVSYAFGQLGDIIGYNLTWLMWIGWFTLACYMVNELRSLVENLVEIGVNVPDILIKGLDITEKLIKEKETAMTGDEKNGN